MKHLSFCLALPLLVVVSFGSMLDPLSSRGQSKNSGKSFAEAAKRNALLSTSLIWTFGSKQQTGWYLYTPLIKQLIGTKQESATVQFAQAVARWQAKSALKPSGVIDEETLYAMIKTWQDARLKDRTQALPDQLLTAPLSDFYDPTRAEELRQVERRTYAAYKRMVSAAIADRSLALAHQGGQLAAGEKYLKIISAFRSREYQEKLRREAPNSGSAGLAVNSPHFTGRALDLYVGGEPVDTRDSNRALQVQTRVYQWLVHNAGRFGFRPYCYEPWHWEYVN
ncbi:MAG: zinc D-Ala-D-Ala carboxypeptidase [Blastocatellia bacterium]|jgi:LAS superfamily LD-carboxypeptidase LdcB|nr:zinc D-Ala-D-Ala carboxypeptidase [Blastocatellia bacterium]